MCGGGFYPPPGVLSIPLGELDFLGHSFGSPRKLKLILSIPLGELDFLGPMCKSCRGVLNVLSIPLGELDFLGRAALLIVTFRRCALSIPLGELDFLGLTFGLKMALWYQETFQFPLGN